MNLYRVTNGWIGNGDVYVLVIAPEETAARAAASDAFRRDALRDDRVHPHPETYWVADRLDLELLCADTTTPWTSDVWD